MSVLRKIEFVRRLWEARAEADGETPGQTVDNITDVFVVTTLLAEATDAELAEFGGTPKDEAALEVMVAAVKRKPKK